MMLSCGGRPWGIRPTSQMLCEGSLRRRVELQPVFRPRKSVSLVRKMYLLKLFPTFSHQPPVPKDCCLLCKHTRRAELFDSVTRWIGSVWIVGKKVRFLPRRENADEPCAQFQGKADQVGHEPYRTRKPECFQHSLVQHRVNTTPHQ